MTSLHKKISHEKPIGDIPPPDGRPMLQSYGVLLVIDRNTNAIIQFSEHASIFLKTSVIALQQQAITSFLTSADQSKDLGDWLANSDKLYGRFIWQGDGCLLPVWVYIHQKPKEILLEIEIVEVPHLEEHAFAMMDEIVNLNMDNPYESMEDLSREICKNLALITGYDRTLIYRFESDYSGVVIGEAKRDDMGAFLGIRFPATDIPENIRAMYLSQPLRYIPDVNDNPVSLIPDMKSGIFDLSDVILRAATPVQKKYLYHMGVLSSLWVAIIHNNSLWGLISCQHKTPKKLSLYYRFGLLLLAKVIARQLILIDENKNIKAYEVISQGLQRMQNIIYNESKLLTSFKKISNDLLKFFSADGVAYIDSENICLSGITPDKQQIRSLLSWLVKYHHLEFFSTNNLLREYPESIEFKTRPCGLLAIPVMDGYHYLLLFRKELIKQVLWAGAPAHLVIKTSKENSSLQSFSSWQETVNNQAEVWKSFEISAAKLLRQTLISKQLQLVLQEREINTVVRESEIKKMEALKKKEAELEDMVVKRTNQLSENNTALSDALEQLQHLQESMIQTEKMTTIGQLSAGIAHEINNPLSYLLNNIYILQKYNSLFKTAFNSYSQLMDNLKSNPTYKSSPIFDEILLFNQTNKLYSKLADLDDIIIESIEGALRIKQIVSNLTSFSGGIHEAQEFCDINALLEASIDMVWNELKYKCTVIKKLSNLPQIMISPKQLELVFINLLLNAAQSIAYQGEIKISTDVSDATINISISDTGCGISDENIPKLFTPFFSTKPTGSSSGLGLANAFGFVKRNGGTITVKTELGHGSTFSIHLPIKTNG